MGSSHFRSEAEAWAAAEADFARSVQAARDLLLIVDLYSDPAPDDAYPPACSDPGGHRWTVRDDDEEVSYCELCGADGNG